MRRKSRRTWIASGREEDGLVERVLSHLRLARPRSLTYCAKRHVSYRTGGKEVGHTGKIPILGLLFQ